MKHILNDECKFYFILLFAFLRDRTRTQICEIFASDWSELMFLTCCRSYIMFFQLLPVAVVFNKLLPFIPLHDVWQDAFICCM